MEPKKEESRELSSSLHWASDLNLPTDHQTDFYLHRFSKLTSTEQSLVLAKIIRNDDQAIHTDPPWRTVEIFEAMSQEWRSSLLKRTIQLRPGLFTESVRYLIDHHREYLPALVAMMNAVYLGDEIGLLTARGNRRGHQAVIEAIQDFVGITIPRHNIYFINDENRNERLPAESVAARKLQVLRDFVAGCYTDAQGQTHPLSKNFRKVIFYDDEQKNLDMVRSCVQDDALQGRLVAIDARKMDVERLWKSLIEKVHNGRIPEGRSSGVMRFFDIDGTLVELPAKMYVVDKHSGERYLEVSQADYAAHPDPEHWVNRVVASSQNLHADQVFFDYGDFRKQDRIEQMVRESSLNNSLFKSNGA